MIRPPSIPALDARIQVAVLGATGTVGSRLVERLAAHPWFQLAEVAGSERSEGQPLQARVAQGSRLAPEAQRLKLRSVDGPFRSHLVLSALPAAVARVVEPRLAARGHLVVSNASAFRDHPQVPLIVPEVNPDHLQLLDAQEGLWPLEGGASVRSGGGIVTNPNCAVAGLMPALKPLHDAFGIRRLVVTTLQAISGAGRPGPSAGDLVDNVIPHIRGEEDKIAREPARILGRVSEGACVPLTLPVSATATRVPVLHGHLESVSVELRTAATPDQAREVWAAFRAPVAAELPSAPERAVVLLDDDDRPQPRLDRDLGDGMTVTVGRVRPCPVLTLRFIVLSHNLERGAAGAALLNAELATARDRVRAWL